MPTLNEILLGLKKQLYPNGRAFKMPADSVFERLHKALLVSEVEAVQGATSILNDILPDNDGFDAYDAEQWCRRLRLIYTPDISLADTKLQIRQKMAYPGIDNPHRQAASFIETQLRAAGYDVYLYENRFFPGPVTKTPSEILGIAAMMATMGAFSLGEAELGETWLDAGITICANYIEEEKDALFDIIDYRSTFYIAGATIDTFATMDAGKKDAFRQLLLTLKPMQTVGILFINYV